MFNTEVYRKALYDKLMDKALIMFAEEAFFNALPYSFVELSDSDKRGLHDYVTSAIEQLGGANTILNNAINRVKNDVSKRVYLIDMQKCCHSMAMEASDRIVKNLSSKGKDQEELTFSQAVKDANFNESEYRKFENEADKMEIEEVGDIISKKIVATIKGEQEAFKTEKMLDEKITDLISEQVDEDSDTYEEDVTKGVESFYNMALTNEHPRHYVSLFSKLVNAATESIVALYPSEDGINIKALNDVTFLFGLEEYRKQMSAEEALDRLVDTDVGLINNNAFADSAMESLHNQEIGKKGFVVGATAYTFMETMKTLNLITPSPISIKNFINTTPDPASYGNCAIESFVNRFSDILKEIDKKLHSTKSPDELREYGKHLDDIRDRLSSISIANESFIACRHDVINHIVKTKTEINRRYAYLVPAEESVLNSQQKRMRSIDRLEMVNLMKMYSNNDSTTSFRIIYNDIDNSRLVAFEALNSMNRPVNVSTIYLEGLESCTTLDAKKYVHTIYDEISQDIKKKPFIFKVKSGAYEQF